MRKVKTALLALAAIFCFAAAYRFASHGIRLHDNMCVAFACIAVAVGATMLWFAFLKKPRQRDKVAG